MKRTATRPLPACGHRRLVECPLTVDDWAEVYRAWLAFRWLCLLVAERAHEREGV